MLSKDFSQSRVVIVDDVVANSRLLESSLKAFGMRNTVSFSDSAAALDWLQHNPWNLLLLDLDMPAPNGFDILRALSERDRSCNPIIIITALNDSVSRRTGLELGANDYLSKPVDLPEVILRVRSNLQLSQASQALQETNMSLEQRVRERTAQLNQSYGALVRTLCRASAYRDSETGNHIVRIGESAALIAEAHGMSPEWVELMRQAAPMHDVGKIGIADHILLKPGPLNEEERQLMQQHPAIGHSILTDQHASALTDLASRNCPEPPREMGWQWLSQWPEGGTDPSVRPHRRHLRRLRRVAHAAPLQGAVAHRKGSGLHPRTSRQAFRSATGRPGRKPLREDRSTPARSQRLRARRLIDLDNDKNPLPVSRLLNFRVLPS